jgi:hypothetical protein
VSHHYFCGAKEDIIALMMHVVASKASVPHNGFVVCVLNFSDELCPRQPCARFETLVGLSIRGSRVDHECPRGQVREADSARRDKPTGPNT